MGLEDIVEVTEARRIKGNLYLEHGYRLLSVQGTSEEDKGRLSGNPFVRRGIKYVLGRPESVEHWDPPEWRPLEGEQPTVPGAVTVNREAGAAPLPEPRETEGGATLRPPPPGPPPQDAPSE
jgi:hypothetical protein